MKGLAMNGGCKYKYVLLSLAFVSVGQYMTLFPGITQSTTRKGDYVRACLSVPFGFQRYAPESKCTKVCKAVVGFIGRSGSEIATTASNHPVIAATAVVGAAGTAVGYYIGRRRGYRSGYRAGYSAAAAAPVIGVPAHH
jgi:hypothetical protein